ncbi:MAG TPA: HIT domain-containing protein [Pyrinomonadaceae bacterium]|nr:HIT domain-containing protein [Pyrinomonadaceae bacterium]
MEKTEDFYCEQVLSGKTEVKKILETENVLAFYHTRPFWEIHIVVIPKRHISSLLTVGETETEIFLELFDVIKKVSANVVENHGAARVLTNLGKYQESKHLHFHINSGGQIRPDNKV